MRKPSFYLTTGLLTCAVLGGMSSCSKNDSVVAPATATTADIQVVDGRLAFKDFKTFQQTLDLLKDKSESTVAAWEQGLHFTSLRGSTGQQQVDLKEEFWFPTAYAAILNPQGEFQIGSKSYWFHNGQKLQFNSAAELKQAEAGQTVPCVATYAGYKIVSSKSLAAPASSSELILNNQSGVDARYQYEFNLWNDPGSIRKIVYETYVFTDYNGDVHQYHSVLAMNMKLEYKTRGRWAIAGEERIIQADFDGYATGATSATNAQFVSGAVSVHTSNRSSSNTTFWLKDCWAFDANVHDTSDIYWDFTLGGRLSSWVTSDPGHTYTVQNSTLW